MYYSELIFFFPQLCFHIVSGKNAEIEEKRVELESLAAAREESAAEVGRLKREWTALKRRSDEEVEAVERLKEAKNKADEELQHARHKVNHAKEEV